MHLYFLTRVAALKKKKKKKKFVISRYYLKYNVEMLIWTALVLNQDLESCFLSWSLHSKVQFVYTLSRFHRVDVENINLV